MKNKRKRQKYYLIACFFMVLAVFWIGLSVAYILYKNRWDKTVENTFYTVVSALVALFYYYQAKNVGTVKGEDERDEYLEMKTNSQVFKIASALVLILSLIFLLWGAFLWKNNGINAMVIVVMTIAITLTVLWNVLLLIELILGIFNEVRN